MDLVSEECQKPQPPLLLKNYRNTPPICIAIRLQCVVQCFRCPYALRKGRYCPVLLPFVSQYASLLYCSTPPIRIAVLLGKSWWLRSPGCSPKESKTESKSRICASPVPFLFPPSPPLPSPRNGFAPKNLEDRNLLKLSSLDSSRPFFLSDNSIWGQWTQVLPNAIIARLK